MKTESKSNSKALQWVKLISNCKLQRIVSKYETRAIRADELAKLHLVRQPITPYERRLT